MEVKWFIIASVCFLIGITIGYVINKKNTTKKIDGSLIINSVDNRDSFFFNFKTDLNTLKSKTYLVMKIEKTSIKNDEE